jgi:hypothetical protein
VTTPWPDDLPADLVRALDRLVDRLPGELSHLTDRDRNREAKRIAANARKLLAAVRAFHRQYHDAIVHDWREAAVDAAADLGMDEQEQRLFRAGFDPLELQHVLNGLSLHMDALARPGAPGRRSGFLQRHLVERLADYFTRAGLGPSRDPDGLFACTVAVAFERKGWGDPWHYLRDHRDPPEVKK